MSTPRRRHTRAVRHDASFARKLSGQFTQHTLARYHHLLCLEKLRRQGGGARLPEFFEALAREIDAPSPSDAYALGAIEIDALDPRHAPWLERCYPDVVRAVERDIDAVDVSAEVRRLGLTKTNTAPAERARIERALATTILFDRRLGTRSAPVGTDIHDAAQRYRTMAAERSRRERVELALGAGSLAAACAYVSVLPASTPLHDHLVIVGVPALALAVQTWREVRAHPGLGRLARWLRTGLDAVARRVLTPERWARRRRRDAQAKRWLGATWTAVARHASESIARTRGLMRGVDTLRARRYGVAATWLFANVGLCAALYDTLDPDALRTAIEAVSRLAPHDALFPAGRTALEHAERAAPDARIGAATAGLVVLGYKALGLLEKAARLRDLTEEAIAYPHVDHDAHLEAGAGRLLARTRRITEIVGRVPGAAPSLRPPLRRQARTTLSRLEEATRAEIEDLEASISG